MPDLRSGAISAAARLAGLPWRLKPGHGKPLPPGDPHLRRVVVIKPCCMGDVLMATPAIAALRKALPESHIALAVGEYSQPAVANNTRIDQVITAPPGDGLRSLANELKKDDFGSALVLDRSPLLNAAPRLAGIPVRAGLDSGGRGIALTHPVDCPPGKTRHEVEWYLDVVRALGISASDSEAYLEFYPTGQDKVEARRALAASGEQETDAGFVAIHLGGGSNPGMNLLSKRWQPERWARVADWLAETFECNIVLLGGPGNEDREAADRLLGALFPSTRAYVADLVGRLAWGPLGAAIERCRLFLGHDTGAMHLATAVRVPVVAVFGPSDPARYGPWDPSGRSVVVAPRGLGSDSGALRRASKGGEIYHNAVSTEEVWAAVEKAYSNVLRGEPVKA